MSTKRPSKVEFYEAMPGTLDQAFMPVAEPSLAETEEASIRRRIMRNDIALLALLILQLVLLVVLVHDVSL